MKALLYLVVLLAIVLFGATFFQHNPETITLKYIYGLQIQTHLTVALVVSLIVGILIGWLLSQLTVIRAKSDVRKARKAIRKSERELESLRSIAHSDEDSYV